MCPVWKYTPSSAVVAREALRSAQRFWEQGGGDSARLYEYRYGQKWDKTTCEQACADIVSWTCAERGVPNVFRLAAIVARTAIKDKWFVDTDPQKPPARLAIELGWGVLRAHEGSRVVHPHFDLAQESTQTAETIATLQAARPWSEVEVRLYDLYSKHGACHPQHIAQEARIALTKLCQHASSVAERQRP